MLPFGYRRPPFLVSVFPFPYGSQGLPFPTGQGKEDPEGFPVCALGTYREDPRAYGTRVLRTQILPRASRTGAAVSLCLWHKEDPGGVFQEHRYSYTIKTQRVIRRF